MEVHSYTSNLSVMEEAVPTYSVESKTASDVLVTTFKLSSTCH